MLSKRVWYDGQDEPLPEQVALRAGPLALIYEGGDLRYIRLGEREILRRIYVAVRDRNWGTVPPVLSNVQMEVAADSFRVSYEVENRQGEIDLAWKGTICGDARGTITFAMDGVARSTFKRNRIGFCILHPAAAAGAACLVEHVDGTTERANLPTYIVADQPVPPFAEMRGMMHEVSPGVWAEVRFSGEVFEMEDQRNWTDASYKTFCTPLRLPFPVEVQAGTRVAQTVTLRLRDERPPAAGSGSPAETPPSLTIDATTGAVPLPSLGLGVASHGQPLSERELARFRALSLHHLRVDLALGDADYPSTLYRAAQEANALGVPLEVALLVSNNGDAELDRLREALARIRPVVDTWLVYPAQERFQGGSPVEEVVSLAREHLAGYGPARFASGTNTDLIFMQRSRPPLPLLDAVVFAVSPQVHAFDNASVVETLEAQAAAVQTARRLAGSLPVLVSPVTLEPRFNAYATGPAAPVPPGQLPPQVDVRQMSLLGAGWTACSIKYMALGGAHSVTYYETTGWRGVMEVESGSPLPDKFHSLPGAVFPLYHVLADVGEFAGGEVLSCKSSSSLQVDGLALRKDGRIRLILANLCERSQQVSVRGLGEQVWVRCLDETNVVEAVQSPEVFRANEGELHRTLGGALDVNLAPYAVARVDEHY